MNDAFGSFMLGGVMTEGTIFHMTCCTVHSFTWLLYLYVRTLLFLRDEDLRLIVDFYLFLSCETESRFKRGLLHN